MDTVKVPSPESWRRRRRKEEPVLPSHPRTRPPAYRDPVDFSVRGPVAVSLDDEQLTSPGCSVIDLIFPAPTHVGELVFRNYYTGWISVLVRAQSATAPEPMDEPRSERGKHVSPWAVSIARKTLMPQPHQEVGSHDLVSVVATESVAPWIGLSTIRLVLRQPSPSWRTFLVEEVAVFRDLPRRLPRPTAPPQTPEAAKVLDAGASGLLKECSVLPARQKGEALKVKRIEGRMVQPRNTDGHIVAMQTRAALLWSASRQQTPTPGRGASTGATSKQSRS